MKMKNGNGYAKLGKLIEYYSRMFEENRPTDKEYLELSAGAFAEKAAEYKLTSDEYEMEEETVRLYPYSEGVLRLKIPDLEVIQKMENPSAWPLPGFFDKAYNCDRDRHIAGVDQMPRTPSEAEESLKNIKAKAYSQSKPLTDNKEVDNWRKKLRVELVYEQLGWYSITNCG